jgi:hypothetical protein
VIIWRFFAKHAEKGASGAFSALLPDIREKVLRTFSE